MDSEDHSTRVWLTACALVFVTLVVLWPVTDNDFVSYDDNLYVTENAQVLSGLSGEGTLWAFTTLQVANWHPLTWLSHMLDVQLFGLDAGRHHLVSLLLHAVNALLCFLVLLRMTGALWRSAAVALLFALHPLHVESVAWVAERKDLLSTFFMFLSLGFYAGFAEARRVGPYLLALLFFALGLMAKPMLVTLPFLLLLLDYWPLQRRGREPRALSGLVAEKAPFFLLAAASSWITYYAQAEAGAVKTLERYPFPVRLANSFASLSDYLGKTIWPMKLSVIYPHPGMDVSAMKAFAAALLVLAVTTAVIWRGRTHPYLPVAWLWFLGTFVPVIGLVQVGEQAMADRYTYIPHIGLFVLLVWGAGDLLRRAKYRKEIAAGLLAAALVFFGALSNRQTKVWKTSIGLFEHALDVTENNPIAHYNLGEAYVTSGAWQEGVPHFRRAVEIKPGFADAHYNLGKAYALEGAWEKAVGHFSRVALLRPDYADAYNNLGVLYHQRGLLDRAEEYYRRSLSLDPGMAEAYNNLGLVLAARGDVAQAVDYFRQALQADPAYGEARVNLGRYTKQLGP